MHLFGNNKEFKVLVGLCAWRDIKIYTLESLLNLQACPNPKIHYKIQMGDALISRSRSMVATHFLLKTDCDVLFFIDDDIRISTLDSTKLMWLAKDHCDIVGAVYPTKSQFDSGMVMTPLEYGVNVPFGKEGGMLEVRHIGNGCMVIKRKVLQAMVDSGVPLCKHGEKQYYPFFQHRTAMIDGVWQDLSEDYYFCEEARKLGFKVWASTDIKLYHEGAYLYSWDDVVETKNKTRKTYDNPILRISSPQNSERPRLAVTEAKGATNGR